MNKIESEIGQVSKGFSAEEVLKKIKEKHTNSEREDFVKTTYPSIYLVALKQMGRHEERKQFCRDSVDYYTQYIVEYLEPMLIEMRE